MDVVGAPSTRLFRVAGGGDLRLGPPQLVFLELWWPRQAPGLSCLRVTGTLQWLPRGPLAIAAAAAAALRPWRSLSWLRSRGGPALCWPWGGGWVGPYLASCRFRGSSRRPPLVCLQTPLTTWSLLVMLLGSWGRYRKSPLGAVVGYAYGAGHRAECYSGSQPRHQIRSAVRPLQLRLLGEVVSCVPGEAVAGQIRG